jgi:hypothetical protein
MAKKKTNPKKEKFYLNEKIIMPIAISLPILTFLIFWYVLSSNHLSMDECMDSIKTTSGDYNVIQKIVEICRERQEVFFWPKALWWTVLIWAPIIGFFISIMDDKGYGDGIATAVGLFVGILVGGWILVVFIGMILKTAFY